VREVESGVLRLVVDGPGATAKKNSVLAYQRPL